VRSRHGGGLQPRNLAPSRLTFDLALDPLSLVSEAEASSALSRSLAPELARVPFLIAAPARLAVSCTALPSPWHPAAVAYPNLEIWLRPLIDALSGADRLLVSPSLVDSIRVATRSAQQDVGRLWVTLTYAPDRLLTKRPLGAVAS
jgi:hypothetical protein